MNHSISKFGYATFGVFAEGSHITPTFDEKSLQPFLSSRFNDFYPDSFISFSFGLNFY
jgi:hypothetical protein